MLRRFLPFALLLTAVLCISGCGYHVGGAADMVPKGIQTVAVPAFRNGSTHYQLTDQLPEAISREFMARTRFHIDNDTSTADAVLKGSVNRIGAYPVISDPITAKATTMQLSVNLSVELVERTTGRVLYANKSLDFKTYYQIAIDPHQYFDESGPALDRLSREVAASVVSAVVENF
ncbi:MAG TPA: LPS assembly lipoprotein LptE [Bryobacteraceae bacterium]|nr:LPS assembly lipoprotein LptE [Bryobacteraceae bacterium]